MPKYGFIGEKKQKIHRIREDIPIMRDVLRSASGRIASVVLDLRTFSRGRIDEAREADIPEEIERAIRILHPRLNGAIELKRRFEPGSRLVCYPDALGQVFLNLLANAVDALGEKGTLEVSTARQGDFLEVRVKAPARRPIRSFRSAAATSPSSCHFVSK